MDPLSLQKNIGIRVETPDQVRKKKQFKSAHNILNQYIFLKSIIFKLPAFLMILINPFCLFFLHVLIGFKACKAHYPCVYECFKFYKNNPTSHSGCSAECKPHIKDHSSSIPADDPYLKYIQSLSK